MIYLCIFLAVTVNTVAAIIVVDAIDIAVDGIAGLAVDVIAVDSDIAINVADASAIAVYIAITIVEAIAVAVSVAIHVAVALNVIIAVAVVCLFGKNADAHFQSVKDVVARVRYIKPR